MQRHATRRLLNRGVDCGWVVALARGIGGSITSESRRSHKKPGDSFEGKKELRSACKSNGCSCGQVVELRCPTPFIMVHHREVAVASHIRRRGWWRGLIAFG